MKETLNHIRTRPRFKLITQLDKSSYEKTIRKYITIQNTEIQANINQEVATIWVKTSHNHFWKPYLSLRTETEDNKTIIRGVFGPSSAVWTFFMFLYFLFSILFMVFCTIWFVTQQINSTDFPWAKYAAIISIVLLVVTFLATKMGQKRAKIEMQRLREFAENSIFPLEN